jgi:nitroimidazol reductase NimA-like FMN-containing flavoprotein (pyridoxamine 5'-phosphate oxidase superfamily)
MTSHSAAAEFAITGRTRMRRKAQRASYDREMIHAVLDEALIASVAISIDDQPHVQPMIHVRDGDRLILHGLATNRLLSHIAKGNEVSINVMLLDAFVLARRINDHTMHYRSATVYGRGELVTYYAEKERLMAHVFNHLVKTDRLEHLPPLPDNYLDGTMVVTVPITEAVGRVNQGIATDEGPDGIWSGLVPVKVQKREPIADERTRAEGAIRGAPAA